mmetsp:Transcript_58096/g.96710  ORF Transcript_58096/g.96710 Transcript_58096/m.96710 type:complete len:137 (+) Transcript_58096:78-488(+)
MQDDFCGIMLFLSFCILSFTVPSVIGLGIHVMGWSVVEHLLGAHGIPKQYHVLAFVIALVVSLGAAFASLFLRSSKSILVLWAAIAISGYLAGAILGDLIKDHLPLLTVSAIVFASLSISMKLDRIFCPNWKWKLF